MKNGRNGKPYLRLVENEPRPHCPVVCPFRRPPMRRQPAGATEVTGRDDCPETSAAHRPRQDAVSVAAAARILNTRIGLLIAVMSVRGWIFRRRPKGAWSGEPATGRTRKGAWSGEPATGRTRKGSWQAYPRTVHEGFLVHGNAGLACDEHGEILVLRLRITAKGLGELAELLGRPSCEGGQGA